MIAASCALLALDGLWLPLIAAVVLIPLLCFGPWLLSPYSKRARRHLNPPDEVFERWEARADRLGRVPVFGRLWRSAERLSGDRGRQEARAYRDWLRKRNDSG